MSRNSQTKNNTHGSLPAVISSGMPREEALIREQPADDLRFVVVIPSFNESGLHHSLDSLFHAHPVDHSVEIVVVINWPEDAGEEIREINLALYRQYSEMFAPSPGNRIQCHFILAGDLPSRYAGAGLARKTGMDEAVRRFVAAGTYDGIILSFDADTTCQPDYFTALKQHFDDHPGVSGCNIRFEHPLTGEDFPPEVYHAVAFYELHMRYYLRGLRRTGHPNVYHTVGSAFAVRTDSYCRQGGMNRKKAGEDFYFLQKLFDEGNFSECNSTTVIPSPRPSNRVIFGTGPSVSAYLRTGLEPLTFHPSSFVPMEIFLKDSANLFRAGDQEYDRFISGQEDNMQDFLRMNDVRKVVQEINANAASPAMFHKRLLRWFNMFRMLKFLNHARQGIAPVPVTAAARMLLEYEGIKTGVADAGELLRTYRELELAGK